MISKITCLCLGVASTFFLTLTACEPAPEEENLPAAKVEKLPAIKTPKNVTVIKSKTGIAFVTNCGCVARGWTKDYHDYPERTLKWADKHISGEITPSQINTKLMTAVVLNRPNKVAELLATDVDIEETNASGCTAFIWAIAFGRDDIFNLLLSEGIDVNRTDSSGATPLMIASKAGNVKFVNKLISLGVDVNKAQTGGCSETGRTALHAASEKRDNSKVIEILIRAGANVDAVDERGKTALMAAAFGGRFGNVRALIEAGANIRQKSNEGKTAADYALMLRKYEVAEYLNNQN